MKEMRAVLRGARTADTAYGQAPVSDTISSLNRFGKGAFRWFGHVHEFREDSTPTTMVDGVAFAAPFGPTGRLIEKLLLARYLQNLIETRNRHLAG